MQNLHSTTTRTPRRDTSGHTTTAVLPLHELIFEELSFGQAIGCLQTPFTLSSEGIIVAHRIADSHRASLATNNSCLELPLLVCAIAHRIGSPWNRSLLAIAEQLPEWERTGGINNNPLTGPLISMHGDRDAWDLVESVTANFTILSSQAQTRSSGFAQTKSVKNAPWLLADSLQHHCSHALLIFGSSVSLAQSMNSAACQPQ